MGRGKAWYPKADVIHASNDPIVGNYQEARTFWQSVQAAYSSLSTTNEERSIEGLKSRWADINKMVTKFNGNYLQIKRVPRSGFNEEKYLEDALLLYQDEEKERFPFLLCWSYLKEQAKWVANAYALIIEKWKTFFEHEFVHTNLDMALKNIVPHS